MLRLIKSVCVPSVGRKFSRPIFGSSSLAVGLASATLAAAAGTGLLRQADGPRPSVEEAAGQKIFEENCAACHGGGAAGGPGGAPSLLRSPIATANDGGKTLRAFLAIGRPEKGMPPFPMSSEQAVNLSAALQKIASAAASARNGGRKTDPASVLVGDAERGKAFFNGDVGKCSSCHAVAEAQASPATNLAHIATTYPEPKLLQNRMVLNRSFFWSPSLGKDVTATIIHRDGRKLSGYLTSISDFKVVIRDEQGAETTIPRKGGEPRVDLTDRLQHHLDLLDRYQDNDIHDLTAYLATLK